MTTICLIPGDGIGREVIPAARRLLEASGLGLAFVEAHAGWEAFQRFGSSVPAETLERIRSSDATLAGAFTSPTRPVAGFSSAIRAMRRELDLYANLRPARSRPVAGSRRGIDMLMVRENSEGLYVAQERRFGRVALDQARRRRRDLAIVHKANVLPVTSGLFLETVRELAAADPDVTIREVIVDAAAMMLVREPESWDVLVTTNLFGDILSDLMAALVGGLGLAPSANLGDRHAIFEPVHGSAPDIAGRGIANPTAAMLSAAMMLEHLGQHEIAARIDRAIDAVLAEGPVTPDLGGRAGTEAFTDAVIEALAGIGGG